jgi:hypothetical protein
LQQLFASGINVVVDYLWGESAKTVIVAIAKAVDDGTPVRFVHVGGASGEQNVELPVQRFALRQSCSWAAERRVYVSKFCCNRSGTSSKRLNRQP